MEILVDTHAVGTFIKQLRASDAAIREHLRELGACIVQTREFWSGDAQAATETHFSDFLRRYETTYAQSIEGYIKFLEVQVAQGYFDTESTNTTLGGAAS
ncbi:MAG: hypothetical protein LBN08_05625 [Lactobacillales bacterium]|jgi:hypothetical protein|nr:hypothetical protein [Lactobacillales bacterium]